MSAPFLQLEPFTTHGRTFRRAVTTRIAFGRVHSILIAEFPAERMMELRFVADAFQLCLGQQLGGLFLKTARNVGTTDMDCKSLKLSSLPA